MRRERYGFIALIVVITSLAVLLARLDGPDLELDRAPAEETSAAGDDARRVPRRGPVPHAGVDQAPPPVRDVALHVPVLDARVRSGDARAEFRVVDGRGRPLPESARLAARLVRVVDGVRLREHASVDAGRSSVLCAGRTGGGLEPGDYALKITAGPYGGLWKDFSLAAGQLVRETVPLETWTRIVRLSFVDRSGHGLDRIPNAPRYRVEDVRVPDREFSSRPPRRLRSPPGTVTVDAIGVGGGGVGSSGGWRRRPTSWLTSGGAWYLTVVAGTPGHLSMSLSERSHGRESLEIDSTFTGPEWDDHRIVLEYSDAAAARLARLRPGNPLDPGHESELAFTAEESPEPDPVDLPAELARWRRVVVRADVPPSLELEMDEPRHSYSMLHLGLRYRDRRPRRSAGVWFTDVALDRADQLVWRWTDHALFESAPRSMSGDELAAAEKIVERHDAVERAPIEVEIGAVSPTFDGWAREVAVAWSGGRTAERMYAARRSSRGADGVFHIATAVRLGGDGRPVFGRSVRIRFRGDADASLHEVTRPWPAGARGGRIELDPRIGGLILRAVDDRGEALPFVEGSLLELERRATAERIRDVLRDHDVAMAAHPRSYHEELGPETGSDELRRLLGDDLWDALGDDAARLHVARNAAWYDPRRRLSGDDRGYLIDFDVVLRPGGRYVLWLWSRSRDANAPDRAVVFEASDGLTDLGAIELPR